jgi:hypothetical protein
MGRETAGGMVGAISAMFIRTIACFDGGSWQPASARINETIKIRPMLNTPPSTIGILT